MTDPTTTEDKVHSWVHPNRHRGKQQRCEHCGIWDTERSRLTACSGTWPQTEGPGLSTHPSTEAVGQVRRGSSLDYCERWPDEDHNWLTTLHAGVPRITTALAEAEKLRKDVLARDYWARDVVFYHELPEQPGDDHFATIAKALKAVRADLDSERKRVLVLLADLRQAKAERAAIALQRDELLSERRSPPKTVVPIRIEGENAAIYAWLGRVASTYRTVT